MIKVKGMRLCMMNAYSPTDSSESERAKVLFYNALSKAKLESDKKPKFKQIALGDFNATISSSSKEENTWDSILGPNNSDKVQTNGNGEKMLEWCHRHQMKIINTIYRTKRIHRETWRHPLTGNWKRIDYICTTPWVSKFIKSCRVHTTASNLFDTDHRLLVLNLEFPSTKKDLKINLSRQRPNEKKPKSDYQALCTSSALQQELTDELDSNLNYSTKANISDLNDHIVDVVRDSVEKICPRITEQKKKEPWENDELKQLIRGLNTCTDYRRTRELQKTIKKKRTSLKNEYYKKIASEINTLAEAREVEKEFNMAKKYGMIKRGSRITISNQKLHKHFEQHFSARELPMPPELKKPENFPHLSDEIIPVNEEKPDNEETAKVLKTFKNKKSGGTDKTKTEGLKYNRSKTLINAIVYLLAMIWTLVEVPSSWLHCSITCLHKKGPMSIASNYRGLSIGANMSRILAKIIMNRLQQGYEKNISEEQYGFRKNRSTSDGIFLIKNIIEKYGGP